MIYLAYGSNMDEEQMAYRCPGAKLLGKGIIKNWELLFKGSKTGSYATIERKKGIEVPVLYWEIDAAHEASLDRYEGYPSFYYKRSIYFYDENGNKKLGMVYIMHENRKLGAPSMWYFQVLLNAYAKFGFDAWVLHKGLWKSSHKGKIKMSFKEV